MDYKMKTIKIEKEFKIPGTDIILESGDTIKVEESEKIQESMQDLVNHLEPHVTGHSDLEKLGERIGLDLSIALTISGRTDIANSEKFANGISKGLRDSAR